MHFKINGIEYSIIFKHETKNVRDRHTYCIIELSENRQILVEEDAYCHPNDNFCKETGRKLALARALKALGVPVEFRREAWLCYLNRGNPFMDVIEETL